MVDELVGYYSLIGLLVYLFTHLPSTIYQLPTTDSSLIILHHKPYTINYTPPTTNYLPPTAYHFPLTASTPIGSRAGGVMS